MTGDGTDAIRVLVVEDSAVQQEMLLYLLEEVGHFDVVGTAVNGVEGVSQVERLHPDVVLMDCQMPEMDGIAATRTIMERCPTPVVVMTASLVREDVSITFDAVKSGALAVVGKPTALGAPDHDRLVEQLLRTLRLMSEVKVVRKWPVHQKERRFEDESRPPHCAARARMIALAGSTGAPAVFADILGLIGAKVSAPVLILQHMAEGFVDGFALWLRQKSGMTVCIAQDGVLTEAGCAYVAPDGFHLGVDEGGRIVLTADPAEDGFRPSATRLFKSLAHAFGPASMGVLLTGMGRDGAAGLLDLRRAGGITVAQSEESCIVFGMPREAIRLDAARYVLDPSSIARLVVSCAGIVTERDHGTPKEINRT